MSQIEVEAIASPAKELRYKRRVRLGASLQELWRARELVRALAERQLRARYKQALLGFAWAVIPPLIMMVVLSFFVQRVVDVQTRGIPYPLFSYVALLPWTFFAGSIGLASGSLIGNKDLLNKVHCPREVFPLASVVTATVDMAVALLPLGVLLAVYSFVPNITTLYVPVLFAVQVAFTLAVSLFLSALVVYVRDLRHALPIIIQLGLFATPIAYGIEEIPRSLRVWYSALNPLAPVIDGYRRTVLLGEPPAWDLLLPGTLSAFLLLAVAFFVFKRLETGFADVA
jgi:ABC-2 type transport system permease protein/lipopolysaccharide transport system permease protein